MPKQSCAWHCMHSGCRLGLLDPAPIDVAVKDIAHGYVPQLNIDDGAARFPAWYCDYSRV